MRNFLEPIYHANLALSRLTHRASLHHFRLSGLHNVTVLSLNKNRIQALPAGLFASTPRLLNLTMMRNSFRYLDSEIFRGLDHIQEVGLRGL